MDELFSFLSRAPNIESFGLQDVRSVSDKGRAGLGPIVMSNMKTIHFDSSDLQSAFTILSHLSLPTWSLIRFDNMKPLKALPADSARPLTHLFKKAELSVHNVTHVELGSDSRSGGILVLDGPSRRIQLVEKSRWLGWGISDCLGLRRNVSFSTVTSLTMYADYWNADNPITFFQAFPHLAELSLEISFFTLEPRPESLIHVLAFSPATCPDIHSLSIACVTSVQDYGLNESNAAAADLAKDLTSLAKARELAGIPLRSLTVQLHQVLSCFTEKNDTAVYEMRRKLYALLAEIVEEFRYMEPEVKTIQFGVRMADRFLPDDRYWDIMEHRQYS